MATREVLPHSTMHSQVALQRLACAIEADRPQLEVRALVTDAVSVLDGTYGDGLKSIDFFLEPWLGKNTRARKTINMILKPLREARPRTEHDNSIEPSHVAATCSDDLTSRAASGPPVVLDAPATAQTFCETILRVDDGSVIPQ